MALDIKKGNKTYEFSNSSVDKILSSKAFGLKILSRNHANDAAAKALCKWLVAVEEHDSIDSNKHRA